MRLLPVFLTATLLGGCGVLGLGKKPSPFQGVLRLETAPTARAGAPLRVALQNDSPRPETLDPCTRLVLERFNGLGWTPVPAYRACPADAALAPVTLAPGQGTALDLAPVPVGVGYRFVLLAEGAEASRTYRTGRPETTQSSTTFAVTR